MTTVEKQVIEVNKELARLYFSEHNYEKSSEFLGEEITWIGTEEEEVYLQPKEAMDFFMKKKEILKENCMILEERYETTLFSETMCCVMANIKLDKLENDLRFSCIWKRKGKRWYIVHVHTSIAQKIEKF